MRIMKLPAPLQKLVGKVVTSDSPRANVAGENLSGQWGIVFDWSALNAKQQKTIVDHFGDCSPGDFKELIAWTEDDEGCSYEWQPKDWQPLAIWGVREESIEKAIRKQAKSKTATIDAYHKKNGTYPQYGFMLFVSTKGAVSGIACDGTFIPEPKAQTVAKSFSDLKLRQVGEDEIDDDENDG
jgi:hypothetical protein